MLRSTYGLRELRDVITSRIKEVLGRDAVGVVVFGSTIYLGSGRDVDLIVITKGEVGLKDRLEVEYRIKKELEAVLKGSVLDVHVMDIEEFRSNLRPGTFLSGLALGYEVLKGEEVLEPLILNFLRELSKGRYVLHNRYGTWNLSHHARVTYDLKVRRLKKIKDRDHLKYP